MRNDIDPIVLCDGCAVALHDFEIFFFERDPSGMVSDFFELCATCVIAARAARRRCIECGLELAPGEDVVADTAQLESPLCDWCGADFLRELHLFLHHADS